MLRFKLEVLYHAFEKIRKFLSSHDCSCVSIAYSIVHWFYHHMDHHLFDSVYELNPTDWAKQRQTRLSRQHPQKKFTLNRLLPINIERLRQAHHMQQKWADWSSGSRIDFEKNIYLSLYINTKSTDLKYDFKINLFWVIMIDGLDRQHLPVNICFDSWQCICFFCIFLNYIG